MKREQHFVPAKERINMFYGELTDALQVYECKEIVRKGDRLTIKTELLSRASEEKNLVVETKHKLDLVGLLSCNDNDLKMVICQYVERIIEVVKTEMTRAGMTQNFYKCYWI